MLMPASPEFVTLCRSQIAILTQALGASLSVVYLTEELPATVNANLIPVAAYPDAVADWEPEQLLSLLSLGIRRDEESRRWLNADSSTADSVIPAQRPALPASQPHAVDRDGSSLSQQIVLPMIHEGVMMGLLVTARSDRAWSDREQRQVERIADTLSLACVLDQRSQWAERDLHQHHLLRSQQHDRFDDLLHQFRNPLTALRTFGKLLLKRLLTGDPNRDVATGIVRESDRLQELLKQFDQALELGENDYHPQFPTDAEGRSPSDGSNLAGPANQLPPETHRALLLPGAALSIVSCAIADLLHPLLVSAEAIAQDQQLTLHAFLPTEAVLVQADGWALREVLSNLLDNALKYTPSGGSVYVWVGDERKTAAGKMVGIAIADTGPGIPLADQEHLFERHYRGVQAQTDIPGTGLGLAIARDLVRQMQGDIQVISPVPVAELPSPLQVYRSASDRPGTLIVVWLPSG